jgi:hypothetical protein
MHFIRHRKEDNEKEDEEKDNKRIRWCNEREFVVAGRKQEMYRWL